MVITLLIGITIFSCKKIEEFSEIPEITFKDFILVDTLDKIGNKIKHGELIFDFIDGDGDIGIEVPDSINNSDTSNLFFTLYKKIDGDFVEVDTETPIEYRIPFMEPKGQNKTLKGEIKIEFEYYLNFEYDTIKYEFYLVDRAKHKSNIESTPEISFLTDD